MKAVNTAITDSKPSPHSCSCITSPGSHTTTQVACSVSTKPDMVPTDISVSFPFSPLLGAFICMFVYIYIYLHTSSVLHCHSLLPHMLLSYTVSSGGLTHTAFFFSFLPAYLHPSVCPFPLQTIAPPQCRTARNGGATIPTILRSLLLPSLSLSLCEMESVFLTTSNEGRCLNPFWLL